jgi:hypothetical protein
VNLQTALKSDEIRHRAEAMVLRFMFAKVADQLEGDSMIQRRLKEMIHPDMYLEDGKRPQSLLDELRAARVAIDEAEKVLIAACAECEIPLHTAEAQS